MDYRVHGILQARILEWVDFPFSGGSSQPRDPTQVTYITGVFFTNWATREAHTRYQIDNFDITPYIVLIELGHRLSCHLQTYVSTPVDMPATHSQIHNHNNNLHSLNTFSC